MITSPQKGKEHQSGKILKVLEWDFPGKTETLSED